ncbi:MAG: capsule biosynthesis protein [Clostridia bacterium]|nr:capsule biosynthesis protein [Clostridia bacterium]
MLKKFKVILLTLLCMLLVSCSMQLGLEPAVEVVSPSPEIIQEKEPEVLEATVLAVGDIMFHLPQVTEARTETGYDFGLSFEKIKNYISSADVAIANFETTVNEKKALSGYPRFNSPPEVLEGIGRTGFDVMVTANNHCMDTGVEGAENTAALIKKNNMIPVGVGENHKNVIIDKNGIKLGVLAYTSSINGLKAPAGYVSMVDEEQIKRDIEALQGKSDFIIVYLHAGIEYNREVEEETAKLFRTVADLGADCVLGSHPHVARKSELYHTRNKQVLINYSMGNFLSNQNDKYTDIGTMTRLVIRKEGENTTLGHYEIMPTYRLRFRDTDGKTKRRIILASDIDNYSHISDKEKVYIREVKYEVTQLLKDEKISELEVK